MRARLSAFALTLATVIAVSGCGQRVGPKAAAPAAPAADVVLLTEIRDLLKQGK